LVILVAGPVPASAQSPRHTVPIEAIDTVFERFDSRDTPGCSVAVIDAGELAFKKSYGMADPALGVPMTSSTSSWIPYSEARIFVALAVAMLVKGGEISLDDPIRRHVPQVPEYASAVTVRHLLHHTSGLADYGVLAGPGQELHDRLSEDEFFRIISRWGSLGFDPGQSSMYSNTDYALLKILVERASGSSLHDYLSAKLFRPRGMSATRIGFDQSQVVAGHALFHESGEDGFRRLIRYRVSPVGGISVTTSLDDIVRFDAVLRDPTFGWAEMLEDLEKGAPSAEPDGTPEGYAFGMYGSNDEGLPLVEYRGVGYFTYLVQVPSADLSIATLCNSYSGMDSFASQVAQLIVRPRPAEETSQSAATTAAITADAAVLVPATELQSYVGEYRDESDGTSVDVSVVDGVLRIAPRRGPALPALMALGDGKFSTNLGGTPYRLEFKSEDGEMSLTSWDMATNESGGPALRRAAVWQPSVSQLVAYSGVYTGDNVEVTLHVRLDGERLLIATSGLAEAPLSPDGEPDRFRLPALYKARFERDGNGHVVAVVLDATRVQGIRFTRMPGQAPA